MEKQYTKEEVFDTYIKMGIFINPIVKYQETVLLHQSYNNIKIFEPTKKYDITKDIFYLNSIVKEGKNEYEEFINNNFYKLFGFNSNEFVDDKIKDILLPFLCTRYDSKKNKRLVCFSPEFVFIKALSFLNVTFKKNELSYNPNKFYKASKRELTELTDILKRITNNDKASINDYKYIKDRYNIDIVKGKTIDDKNMFLLEKLLAFVKRLKNVMLEFQNNSKEFNLIGFLECFDLEKLYLVLSKCTLDFANSLYKFDSALPLEGITEALSYVTNTTYYLGKDYNVSIKCYDNDNDEYYEYDFQRLKKELNEYCSRFPSQIKSISIEEVKEQGIDKADKLVDYIKEKEKLELDTLKASWKFMEKGERIRSNFSNQSKPKKDLNKNGKKDDGYYVDKLNERLEIFHSTNYLYQIIGMDKFAGYIGFIYADGTVLFEKFYEITENNKTGEEEKRPCKSSNATYRMNIYNFVKFSKLTKQEIMDYIKNVGSEDLQRLYHSKNWAKNIKNKAEQYSKNGDLDIYNEINDLINKGHLRKN